MSELLVGPQETSLDTRVIAALELIDAALSTMVTRELVSTAEASDTLLDVRCSLAN